MIHNCLDFEDKYGYTLRSKEGLIDVQLTWSAHNKYVGYLDKDF